MHVASIVKPLLVVWLSQLTITGGKVFQECLGVVQQNVRVTCPPGEVLSRVDVALISDPDFDDEQCELAMPKCAWTSDWCNGEQFCAVDFDDGYCNIQGDENVIRVKYNCHKVFEGCRADGEQGGFGCPPQHGIQIFTAEVGFNTATWDDWYYERCRFAEANCSWSIDPSRHLTNCDEQQWCHLTREVYNLVDYSVCPDQQDGNVIRIMYDCINYESEGTTVTSTVTDAGKVFLTDGAIVGIIVGFVLLLLLVIVLVIIIICLYRRMASRNVNNAGNSHDQNAPNAYEMSSSDTTPAPYSTVQLEAGAPAQSRNAPAPAPRFSQRDHTLVDNDLYE